jgi:hypothetical protein
MGRGEGETEVAVRMALCWICEQEEATTREHRSKRSDLKAVLGDSGGAFLHTDKRWNRRVQSIDSKLAKYEPSLCATCNNERTQPHDFAWEVLSASLRRRSPPLIPGGYVRGNRIFRYGTSRKMRDMHLFFLKWLGCQIVETSIPIVPGIDTFGAAIMAGKPHKNIWLSFGLAGGGSVAASDLDAANFTGTGAFDYLARFYIVDDIAVRVRFSSVKLPDDWHPQNGNRFLIADYP